MSSTLTKGCSVLSSPGDSATVSMPMPRNISTLLFSAPAS